MANSHSNIIKLNIICIYILTQYAKYDGTKNSRVDTADAAVVDNNNDI